MAAMSVSPLLSGHACRGLDGDWGDRGPVGAQGERSRAPAAKRRTARESFLSREEAVRPGKKVERAIASSRPASGQIRLFERPRGGARKQGKDPQTVGASLTQAA